MPPTNFSVSVVVEHVDKGVRLFFQPEPISKFDVVSYVVDGRLAGAVDYRVVVWVLDGTSTFPKFVSEELERWKFKPRPVPRSSVLRVGKSVLVVGLWQWAVHNPNFGDEY
jgi:hypothetical protein